MNDFTEVKQQTDEPCVDDKTYDCNVAKLTFIQEKVHYLVQLAFSKMKNIDEKLNMTLVFNAALFILLTIVLPIQTNDVVLQKTLICFIVLFGVSEIVTVSIILIALFPKKYLSVDIEVYTKEKLYEGDLQSIYEKQIEWDLNTINDLNNLLSKKSTLTIVSLLLSLVNIALILVSVIIGGVLVYV